MFNCSNTTAGGRWVKLGKIVCSTKLGLKASFMSSKNSCLSHSFTVSLQL
ncbi:hypothetical protein OIU76_017918, partial [Salix suchowensis]